MLHFGWVGLLFDVGGVLAGVGLLLRKKWAWRVAVAFAALWMVSNIIVLVFSLIFIDESLLILGSGFSAAMLCLTSTEGAYCGFSVCYLMRQPIRILFGIGTAHD